MLQGQFIRPARVPGRPERRDDSKLRMELANGSRILSLPSNEQTVRGYSADLIVLDEAARCDDDLISALAPMLGATGGTLVGLSTPYGKRGWYYEQ